MNITTGQHYQIVEFDKGVILIASNDKLERRDSWPLIIGNAETCSEYLLRYLRAREKGGDQAEDQKNSCRFHQPSHAFL